jgi:hypothetical protein
MMEDGNISEQNEMEFIETFKAEIPEISKNVELEFRHINAIENILKEASKD